MSAGRRRDSVGSGIRRTVPAALLGWVVLGVAMPTLADGASVRGLLEAAGLEASEAGDGEGTVWFGVAGAPERWEVPVTVRLLDGDRGCSAPFSLTLDDLGPECAAWMLRQNARAAGVAFGLAPSGEVRIGGSLTASERRPRALRRLCERVAEGWREAAQAVDAYASIAGVPPRSREPLGQCGARIHVPSAATRVLAVARPPGITCASCGGSTASDEGSECLEGLLRGIGFPVSRRCGAAVVWCRPSGDSVPVIPVLVDIAGDCVRFAADTGLGADDLTPPALARLLERSDSGRGIAYGMDEDGRISALASTPTEEPSADLTDLCARTAQAGVEAAGIALEPELGCVVSL